MCLHTTKMLPRIAMKDIETYKVVAKLNGEVYSPYREKYKWELNQVIKDKEHPKIIKVKFYRDGTRLEKPERKISRGFFHTYPDLLDAKKLFSHLSLQEMFEYSGYTIVKCVIPKGTLYYTGVDDNNFKCYASRKLKMTDMEVISQANLIITRKINFYHVLVYKT